MTTQLKGINSQINTKQDRWNLLPLTTRIRSNLSRKKIPSIFDIADKEWEISPPQEILSRPAYFLPNQLERVTGTAYIDDPVKEMPGGFTVYQQPSRGFLVKDAYLIDGGIYKENACIWLNDRVSRLLRLRVENEVTRGAMYSSYEGNNFFGLWLTDDCAAYPLAKNEGIPITTDHQVTQHIYEYEKLLNMNPIRLRTAFVREMVVFDDTYQTIDKQKRFQANRKALLSHFNSNTHSGVFILRRDSGKRRILNNELEIAEYLRINRGFQIVDVTKDSVSTILSACSGAQVIIGVEGSQLIHGIMVLEPGKAVLTLQPPDRFCGVIKRTMDRDEQHYGFVVGHQEANGYRIDIDEIERTLDLFPKSVFI